MAAVADALQDGDNAEPEKERHEATQLGQELHSGLGEVVDALVVHRVQEKLQDREVDTTLNKEEKGS